MEFNMIILTIVSTGFVVVILAQYAAAVQPNIIVQDIEGDYPCSRQGCPDGQYCLEKCRDCSPCPDVNNFRVSNNQITVVGKCVRDGMCPNICSGMLHLQPHQQANESICYESLSPKVCDLPSCNNGGTLDKTKCQCTCSNNWNGPTCSDCGLLCLNGGKLDEANCGCGCVQHWTGNNCTDCGLNQIDCQNGGTLNSTSCTCLCRDNWTGDTCSECGLLFCQNGGTLNSVSCQCLCSEGWTGEICSEEKGVINDTTQNEVDDGGPFPVYVVVICVAAILGIGALWFIIKKMKCNGKPSSSSPDVESVRLIECSMEVNDITLYSISVRARDPSQKFVGKPMKFSCKKADTPGDSVVTWSDAKKWNSNVDLLHTFEDLLPGVNYVISLHAPRYSQSPVKSLEATTYYPLSITVSGMNATVTDLKGLDVNAIEVCSCLMLTTCRKWLPVPAENDSLEIVDIPPGFDFCVKAGVVDSTQVLSQQKFICTAEGKLHVPEIAQDESSCNCATFQSVLRSDISLRRSLQVEFESKENRYLAEMVAKVLKLEGDDYKKIRNATTDHSETLDEILSSKVNNIHIHDLIKGIWLLETSSQTETMKWNESEEFIRKLVGYTRTNFQCRECISLLHQGHHA